MRHYSLVSVKPSILIFSLLSFSAQAATCLGALRLEVLKKAGKNPQAIIYKAADYREGEKRDVLVYLHGLSSVPQSFERSGLQADLRAAYESKEIPEPIVVSLSMGSQALAGVEEHGAKHPVFVPTRDYWYLLQETLKEERLEDSRLFFLANSAGAFNVFQMLRDIPENIHVESAVFYSFPIFTESGLGLDRGLDAPGTLLRVGVEPFVAGLMRDPFFARLSPQRILSDNSFPKNIPVLIQGGEFDALAYTPLNIEFSRQAQAQGLPLFMHVIEGMGHYGKYNHDLTLDFFQRGRTAANPKGIP